MNVKFAVFTLYSGTLFVSLGPTVAQPQPSAEQCQQSNNEA